MGARPSYGADGDIIDAGADLSAGGGVNEHCFDVIYVVSFVHAVVVLWKWFWLVLLVIPSYAFFRAMKDFIIPWCVCDGPAC